MQPFLLQCSVRFLFCMNMNGCKCSGCMTGRQGVKLELSFLLMLGPLGLWVGCGQQRHIVPPPPAQWGAFVLLPVSQRLGQRLPLALGKQQDGQHGQQSQGGVDNVVQEVAVVVPQIHERGAQAAHAAQGQHGTHATTSVDTHTFSF